MPVSPALTEKNMEHVCRSLSGSQRLCLNYCLPDMPLGLATDRYNNILAGVNALRVGVQRVRSLSLSGLIKTMSILFDEIVSHSVS